MAASEIETGEADRLMPALGGGFKIWAALAFLEDLGIRSLSAECFGSVLMERKDPFDCARACS